MFLSQKTVLRPLFYFRLAYHCGADCLRCYLNPPLIGTDFPRRFQHKIAFQRFAGEYAAGQGVT